MNLIFATHNQHKVEEVNDILKDTNIMIKSLSDYGCDLDVEETGDTFEANALLKASAIFELYQIPVFSEDSGLVVDAIGGLPGVHSARYAGPDRDHDQNIDKLLNALKDSDNRAARFVSNVCFYDGQQALHFKGTIEGRISDQRMGSGGFGYDPVFIPDGYDQSFAQLSETLKNKISHRNQSINAFCEFLNSLSNSKM